MDSDWTFVRNILTGGLLAYVVVYLFSSRRTAQCSVCKKELKGKKKVPPCSHKLHEDCYRFLLAMGEMSCPVLSCAKPFVKGQVHKMSVFDLIKRGPIPESLFSGNEEDKFWRKFFETAASGLVEKYKIQVALEGPFIYWDFWTRTKALKKEQYGQALSEVIATIKNPDKEWEVDSIKQLLDHAENVRDLRLRKLRPDNTQSYETHLKVYGMWEELCKAIEDLLMRKEQNSRCTIF